MSGRPFDHGHRARLRAVTDAADDLAIVTATWAVHAAGTPIHRDALRAAALAQALAATADPDEPTAPEDLDIQGAECATLGRRLAELVPDEWTADLAAALADLFDGPPVPPHTAAQLRVREAFRADFASRQLAFPFARAMTSERVSNEDGVSV